MFLYNIHTTFLGFSSPTSIVSTYRASALGCLEALKILATRKSNLPKSTGVVMVLFAGTAKIYFIKSVY